MKAVVNRNPHRLANRPDVFVEQLRDDLSAAKSALVAAAALARLESRHKNVANERVDYKATLQALLTDAAGSIDCAHFDSDEIEFAISSPREVG